MNNPTDEVNLCKGCNTMKHLDTDGYCGRCAASNMTYKELRTQLDRLIIKNQDENGNIDLSDQRAMRDEIIQLFAALCAEVIGEDSISPPPLGDFWAVGRNQLRNDQRTRLAQLTTKSHDN